jgi:hypothetical protein
MLQQGLEALVNPPLVNPILPDQGPPLEETRSDKRKGAVEEGMEEDTFPSVTE